MLADTFNKSVVEMVYEGTRSERELATFIDEDVQFCEAAGPHAVKLLWITFEDMSCVACVIGVNVIMTGMVAKRGEDIFTIET